MNEKLLEEINTNIRNLLLVLSLKTLPEETKYSALKKMGFSAPEISDFTGMPASTVKDRWNVKIKEKRNGKSKGK